MIGIIIKYIVSFRSVLNSIGTISINSTSYKIKNISDIIVFMYILTLKIVVVLKPHSYCVLLNLFGTILFEV